MRDEFPPLPELDYQTAMDALSGYAYPRKALSDKLRRGDVLRVKKGIYAQTGRGIPPYSKEILANMIYGPSYISFEYALSFHGLIPERVEEIRSATTGKTRLFCTPVGRFSYMHMSTEYYSMGYYRETLSEERGFLIARPEKAVMDQVVRAGGRFSLRELSTFLFDNQRIDPEAFHRLDTDLMLAIQSGSNRRNLQTLIKLKTAMG